MRDDPRIMTVAQECNSASPQRVNVRERLLLNQKHNNERIVQLDKQNKAIEKSLKLLDANKNLEQLAELFSVIGNNTY